MSHDGFRVAPIEGVTTITLTNPQKRNALGLELMAALTAEICRIGEDHQTRVIVIAGEGPAFSAGHDLGEMVDRDQDFYDSLFDVCCELMSALRTSMDTLLGLESAEGYDALGMSGAYHIHTVGPATNLYFNFGDSKTTLYYSPGLFWLA